MWSGYLTFGLVTLPVRLYSGARGERVSFHQLHDKDRVRLKQQMVCPADGEVVSRDHIIKGYEYAKGEYVVISAEDIKAAAPHTERQLEIVEFCRASEIDPIWFEASYYLMPEAAGLRPYSLLMKTMQETQYVAVAQLSMHNREYLSLIRPSSLAGVPGQSGEGLLLHTLYYLDEVRVADGFGAAASKAPAAAELKLAKQLVEGLAKKFDPKRFEDHYRKNLEALVASALEGKPAPGREPRPHLVPVSDLMATLKASLQGNKAAAGAAAAKRKPPARATQARRAKRAA
ncbi:MAG TPA: Ku protein [Terriglobales bacterium]